MHNTFGNPVATVDSGEYVDQYRLDTLVGQYQSKCPLRTLGRGASTYIEKIGRFSTGQLDHIHRSHGQTCTIDHAPDIALQPDVAQTVIPSRHFTMISLGLVAQLGYLVTAK